MIIVLAVVGGGLVGAALMFCVLCYILNNGWTLPW